MRNVSWKKEFAVVGMVLIAIGMTISPMLSSKIERKFAYIKSLDTRQEVGQAQPGGLPDCDVSIDKNENRIVTLNRSFLLDVQVTKGRKGLRCETVVFVYSPAFDVKPEKAGFLLPAKNGREEQDFAFNLLPKQAGMQYVVVFYNGKEDRLAYSVESYQYVPLWVTSWSGLITSVLGGVLTLPWWIEHLRRRKQERNEAQKKDDEKRIVVP